MNVVDLLITIVVVTILVTIVLAVVTYVAYKLRVAREPGPGAAGSPGLRYFVVHEPAPTRVPSASGHHAPRA